MRNLLVILLGLLTCSFLSCQPNPLNNTSNQAESGPNLELSTQLEMIAFGSCNRQNLDQPLWSEIVDQNPQLWIWLGDNIYADTENMDLMRQMYQQQLENIEYVKLLDRCPVIGVWDDHDYGTNDGGKEYIKKDESKQLLLEFLAVPKSNEVWGHKGSYQSYEIGPENKRIKVILLDVRYFRDPIEKIDGVYQANENGEILGEEQWSWLGEQLSDQTIDLFIVGGGIQFLPEEHRFEKWANFPNERSRLFQLISEKSPPAIILISGDRHIAEISKIDLPQLPYPLYEVTSSGLTHAWHDASEDNRWRSGPLVRELNYGTLKVHWDRFDMEVTAEIKGQNDTLFVSETFIF